MPLGYLSTSLRRLATRPSRSGARSAGARLPRERGDIVLGWLTKVVVVLAVLGVCAYDGLSIVATKFSLADDGQSAAIAASTAWMHSKDVAQALAAAQASASSSNVLDTVIPTSLVIDPDGTVHLSLQREATTVLLTKIGPLRHWATVTVTAQGRDVGS